MAHQDSKACLDQFQSSHLQGIDYHKAPEFYEEIADSFHFKAVAAE